MASSSIRAGNPARRDGPVGIDFQTAPRIVILSAPVACRLRPWSSRANADGPQRRAGRSRAPSARVPSHASRKRPGGRVATASIVRGESVLADKQAAKVRRRENKEARERAKADRTGDSPAQQAERVRREDTPDPQDEARRAGMDGFVGGDTAQGRPSP